MQLGTTMATTTTSVTTARTTIPIPTQEDTKQSKYKSLLFVVDFFFIVGDVVVVFYS